MVLTNPISINLHVAVDGAHKQGRPVVAKRACNNTHAAISTRTHTCTPLTPCLTAQNANATTEQGHVAKIEARLEHAVHPATQPHTTPLAHTQTHTHTHTNTHTCEHSETHFVRHKK